MAKIIGIKTLTIGYTKDIELAEKIARATGAKDLVVETRPEGETLMLNAEEQAKWIDKGWILSGRRAKKTLVANVVKGRSEAGMDEERKSEMQSGYTSGGYSEGGRLKASMLLEATSEGSTRAEHDSNWSQNDVQADDEKKERGEEKDDDTDT